MSLQTLTLTRGDGKALAITASENVSAATSLIFTAKRNKSDLDAAAVFQHELGAGLTASGTAITVTTVHLDTSSLNACELYWDVQAQYPTGSSPHTVAEGMLIITADVTRALDTSVTIYTSTPGASASAAASAAAAAASASAAAASAASAATDGATAGAAAGATAGATAGAAAASPFATAASNSATAAAGSATAAGNSATAAGASATAAAGSATTAATSATAAGNSATAAATSATNASNSATSAASSATTATTAATSAGNSATAAGASATNADNSATGAAASADEADASATNAAGSATAASTSASAAATSATNASNSAVSASSSATTASTAATNAGNSETAASASASAAATSATNADNSATSASGSATAAAASATAADGFADTAEAARDTVLASLSTYTGAATIATVGTVTTGTWQATPIADAYISSAATWNAKLGPSTTTAAINDSTNRRYVSDAQLVVIGNTSGVNTGDQTSVTGNAGTATKLATARAINGVDFDGTAAITVTAAAGTLTGAALAANITASSLTSAAGGAFGTAAYTATTAYATSAQGALADTAVQPAALASYLALTGGTLTGNITFNDTGEGLSFHGGGTLTGASGAVAIAAAGTNQNAVISPSGTGLVRVGNGSSSGKLWSVNGPLELSSTGNEPLRLQVNGGTRISVTDAATAVTGTLTSTGALSGSNMTGAANPSVSIGLTAVNGSATTFMRSDAAPALSQAIAPTWTGKHTWSATGTTSNIVEINSTRNDVANIGGTINAARSYLSTGATSINFTGSGHSQLSAHRGWFEHSGSGVATQAGAFLAQTSVNSGATVTDLSGFRTALVLGATASVGTYSGLYVTDAGASPGVLGEFHGLHVEENTSAALNYGVYSLPALNYFKGAVAIDGALTTNGGLQTFGTNDSGGAGFRLVLVPNA
jgi:hypothetical protein